ncbi:hypothetical protein [Xanthomonas phaseoli]|uniref:hypothetical protein n=1 Tax=Xanthomonas phaseoli TaxID=1985254 RepID=UPI0012372F0A|nr:hypothetical protein [Xanthomonas phaseoli]
MASFSTVSEHYFCDDTCVIEAGTSEHQFLQKTSFVRYQRLRIEPFDKLSAGIASGKFEQRESLSNSIFDRVVQGVFDSPFSPPKCKAFLLTATQAPQD